MKKKIRIPIYLVLICFLTIPLKSCVDSDDYDFDKLSDKIDWQSNFVAPVGYGEFTLEYLLDQHEEEGEEKTIYFEEDGIHIKYTKANIFEYSVDEILKFPNEKQLLNNVNIALPIIAEGVPLVADTPLEASSEFKLSPDESDIILSQVEIDTKINFSINKPINKDILLDVILLDLDDNVIVQTQTPFEVKQTEANPYLFEWPLSDLVLPFNTTDPTKSNLVKIKFSVLIKDDGNNVSTSGSNIGLSYQLQDINFKLAKGDFGDQTIDIGSGDIDLDVDFWDDIDGDFTFEDPKINLKFNNQVGIPIKFDVNMTASNSDGVTESLDPKPNVAEVITPNYPKTEADVLAGIDVLIPYNKDNSNVVKLLGLPPSGNMTYLGSIKINEKLAGARFNPFVDGLNIVSGNSSISADLDIDIPLDFKADNLSISDTIDEVDIDDAEKMIKASILITAKNGLPLDVKIENIFFTDAAYKVLSIITDESIIKAAGVTDTGEVDPATIKEELSEIELTEAQIKSLNDTENIIINVSMSTTNDGTNPSVKLKGTDKLEFSIAVNAQLDLTK